MKYIKPVIVVAAILLLGACSAVKRQSSGSADSWRADSLRDVGKYMELVRLGYPEQTWPLLYYTEGIKHADVFGDTQTASTLFDKAIELDSLYSPAYYEAARALTVSDPARALGYSEKANEINTTQVWYKGQLGRLLVITGDYTKAEKIYARLVNIAPHNPDNYSMLAVLYDHAKQPFSAIAVLEKAEAVLGKTEGLTSYKRELLIKVGLFDRAIEEARELVNTNPYNYENHLSLAQLYAETKKDSLALASYQMALSLNPGGLEIVASMNEYYKGVGDNANYLATTKQIFQNDDATEQSKVKFFRELTSSRNFYIEYAFQIRELAMILYSKYPDSWDVIELYVDNLFRFGEMEEALVIYKRYVNTGIGGIDLYYEILNVEGYLQRTDSVNMYLGIALKHYPDSPELYMRQAGGLLYMKDDKGALKAYNKALKYASTDSLRSVALGAVGDLYHQKEQHKRSYDYYERALKAWPQNVMVLNNYAYYLSEKGEKLERALEMSKKVIEELEPGNATYIDTYGWVLYKMGRYAEAKKVIQQAVAIDTTKSKELLVHYGDVLYALGEHYMASVYWNRALEAGYDKEEIDERLKSLEGK